MHWDCVRPCWVLVVLVLWIQVTGTACAQIVIEPDQQYEYAQQLLEERQFLRAAEEFQRFAFFFKDHPRQRLARFKAGEAFFLAGELNTAIEKLTNLLTRPPLDDISVNAYFLLSEAFLQMNSPEQAIQQMSHLIRISEDIQVRDRAFWRIGWIHLQNLDWDSAYHAFALISPAGRDQFKIEQTENALQRVDEIPQKSPALAGMLSIIPGAGQVYNARYQDALVAFLVNVGLIWAAVDAFDQDQYALGGLLSFAGVGFYSANIYGAVSGAHKYNQAQKQRFVEQLKQQVTIGVGPAPYSSGHGHGLAVQLCVRF